MDIKSRLIVVKVLTVVSVAAFVVALYTGIVQLVDNKVPAFEPAVRILTTALIVAACCTAYKRIRRRARL